MFLFCFISRGCSDRLRSSVKSVSLPNMGRISRISYDADEEAGSARDPGVGALDVVFPIAMPLTDASCLRPDPGDLETVTYSHVP